MCINGVLFAENIKWFNPLDAGFYVVQNQGFSSEIGDGYSRMPMRAKSEVRGDVWSLSQNSSGLAIYFKTDSPKIKIKYTVSGSKSMPHMPALGVSGIDMYCVDNNDIVSFCFGQYNIGDTITYNYDFKSGNNNEYRIYLPLYNSVSSFEIGVEDGSKMKFIGTETQKPIVVYGTSIAQGACASRPAMAWTNIVHRNMDIPLYNYGFSGNGRLEKEVIKYLCEIDARIYILDCIPNIFYLKEDQLIKLIVDAVKQIRLSSDAPILLVEHAGNSNKMFIDEHAGVENGNKASQKAFNIVKDEKIEGVFYMPRKELGITSPDFLVDYVHYNDYGMFTHAKAIEKKVRTILNLDSKN